MANNMDVDAQLLEADAVERKSIDLEHLPESRVPKWLRKPTTQRRKLIVGGLSIALVSGVVFTGLTWGASLVGYTSLPAERPLDISMCDYYAQKNYYWNSASTQEKLVRSIIDKAFIGAKKPENLNGGYYNGILQPGDWVSIPMDLRKYFDGSMASTNVDGKAKHVNFFSGKNFTAQNRQYPAGNDLFDHMKEGMYRYFAPMLGCSTFGNTVHKYSGSRSMKEVHKYMDFKNYDWMYFIHQIQLGTVVAKFSETDAAMFELFLVEKFGPMIDKKHKKFVPAFENPVIQDTTTPPTFDWAEIDEKKMDIIGRTYPDYQWKRDNKIEMEQFTHHKRENRHHVHQKRQDDSPDFSSKPPPLTSPVHSATNTPDVNRPANTEESTAEAVPDNVLPIALGAGIGAGLAVIFIGIGIAYLVIRKKKLAKRHSMPAMIKPNIEMQDGAVSDNTRTNQRVDRSPGQNAVGKPRHKKNESVGGRSVRFSQAEA